MTVAAAVLAIVGAGGRSAGRRLWILIRDVILERSYRKTMISIIGQVAWMPGCAQVTRVHESGYFWVVHMSSPSGGPQMVGQGVGG